MANMSDQLFDALARAIEHSANVDGATASPLLNEEARNLAGAALHVTEQVCATLAEDLRKTKAERDRLLPFVIQKCSNCGLVTAPVVEKDRLLAIHHPQPVEIERWHEDDEECSERDDRGCTGHMETIQTCATCGAVEDDGVFFNAWPCDTATILGLEV